MNGNVKIKCPNCEEENTINILLAREGSKLLCKKCKKIIKIHFEGESPADVIKKFKNGISKAFKKWK